MSASVWSSRHAQFQRYGAPGRRIMTQHLPRESGQNQLVDHENLGKAYTQCCLGSMKIRFDFQKAAEAQGFVSLQQA
ncbi:hypothetical protein PI124_g18631 [Phytophthora idaei]|nr:hypothetical protein PI124_g18631 [Phytophthora idaei]